MADKPIPPKLRKACDYLMARLWPGVKWPTIEMYLDDSERNQGTMLPPGDNRASAQLRMAEDCLFRDFIDTVSTIAHELTHLRIRMKHGKTVDAHGPEWRAEMKRIGLPVPATGMPREAVERGGLFWNAYQEILAQEFAPEIALATLPAAAPRQGTAVWSAQSAFSGARKPSSSAGNVRAVGPELLNGHHLIFADCSNSMEEEIAPGAGRRKFDAQISALEDFVKAVKGRYSIYGYANNVRKFSTPSEIILDGGKHRTPGFISGTKYSPCFRQAAIMDIDHIHLFSDGEPEFEDETLDEVLRTRAQTSCPISTYYIGNGSNANAVEFMEKLARSPGKVHVVTSEADLINAIHEEIGAEPMPFSVAPRPLRDWDDERKRVLAHTGEVIKNQRHVLNIAATVSDTAHQVGELQEEVKFLRTTNDFAHQVYRHANESLDVVSAQLETDRNQRALISQQNDGWIEGASEEFSRQSARCFVGQLEENAQRSAELHGRRVRRMTLTSLDPAAVARTTALMAGKGLTALPRPDRGGALPSPETPISQGVWGTQRRELVPVKRER